MANEQKYFNVPIQIYKGFLVDSKSVLFNVSVYACYDLITKKGYDFKEAAHHYNINFSNLKHAENAGKKLVDTLPQSSPKVGIGLSMYWQFMNDEKTDFEKASLLAYLAIKSILQQKPYCKIDNRYFLARMDGNAKTVDTIELSHEIKKYANEYQTVKLKNELRNNWGLKTYSRFTRGFYVSFSKLITLEMLITFAEEKRISTKEKQYKQTERETYLRVMKKINNKTTM